MSSAYATWLLLRSSKLVEAPPDCPSGYDGGADRHLGHSGHRGLCARTANTVGIGSPPSLKLSSTNPASTNQRSRVGKGVCVAPTLSLRPLSVHESFVQ